MKKTVIWGCDAVFFAGGGIIKLNSLKFDFPRLISNITFIRDILNLDKAYGEHVVFRPLSDKEWLATMCEFDGVIAPRLHTNIVSYALDIPSVSLVWNDKIKVFADSVNHKSFAPKAFDAASIVDALEGTTNDTEILKELKLSTKQSIMAFCKEYILPKEEKKSIFKKLTK